MKGEKKLNSMKMKPKSQQAKLVNQTKTKNQNSHSIQTLSFRKRFQFFTQSDFANNVLNILLVDDSVKPS